MKVIPCENTAVASKRVSESEDRGVAALSSRGCSKLYGLEILKSDVQNSGNNHTRFICITYFLLREEGQGGKMPRP